MKLVLIAAASRNGVLSSDGKIPWHLPRDVAHFRQRAAGRWLLLGRTTFEQMQGWFSPEQVPVVLTRNPDYAVPGGWAASSVPEAMDLAQQHGADELLVCGGGSVYHAALPWADEVILTRVQMDIPGDVFFPELPEDGWLEVKRVDFSADQENAIAMSILTYQRRR